MDPNKNQEIQHEQSAQRQREREDAARRAQAGEEPWLQESGILSVVDAVRDLEFPATAQDIVDKAGHRDVRPVEATKLPLGYVMPKVQEREFASIREFESAVQRHWEGIRNLTMAPDEMPNRGSQTEPPGVDIDRR